MSSGNDEGRETAVSAGTACYADLVRDIRDAIGAIGSIYKTIGDVLYDEPVDRLSQRIATLVRDKYGDSFASACQECDEQSRLRWEADDAANRFYE